MYKIKNKKDEKAIIDLMNNLKNVNSDWITLRTSREYRIGMVLTRIFKDIKGLNFKSLKKNMSNWLIGINKNRRYKNKINSQNDPSSLANYFSDEKIAIYTCIFGNYDEILEPYFIPDNCEFFIFTDQEVREGSVWKKMPIPTDIENLTNIEKNRYIKMFPHKIFNNYRFTIYVDGNIQIISDLTEYINKINLSVGLGIHRHHLRDCVYDEIDAVCRAGRISKKEAASHRKFLEEDKMPKNYGLLQCNVIVRDSNNILCKKIMEEWWEEFLNYSKRDQISLPHVLFKNSVNIDDVATLGNNVYNNSSFRIILHK